VTPSYRQTFAQPAWGLYDREGGLVATVRASGAQTARSKFKTLPPWARKGGARVRRVDG
jgi:hypothetical protein